MLEARTGHNSDAAQRRFDLVVVWALDRLSREGVAETFGYIKRLTSYGVQFVSFTEGHFRTTGPVGELMIAVAAWIAKQESDQNLRTGSCWIEPGQGRGNEEWQPVGRPKVIFERAKAVELRSAGRSWREIARECGVDVTTVRRVYSSTLGQ